MNRCDMNHRMSPTCALEPTRRIISHKFFRTTCCLQFLCFLSFFIPLSHLPPISLSLSLSLVFTNTFTLLPYCLIYITFPSLSTSMVASYFAFLSCVFFSPAMSVLVRSLFSVYCRPVFVSTSCVALRMPRIATATPAARSALSCCAGIASWTGGVDSHGLQIGV